MVKVIVQNRETNQKHEINVINDSFEQLKNGIYRLVDNKYRNKEYFKIRVAEHEDVDCIFENQEDFEGALEDLESDKLQLIYFFEILKKYPLTKQNNKNIKNNNQRQRNQNKNKSKIAHINLPRVKNLRHLNVTCRSVDLVYNIDPTNFEIPQGYTLGFEICDKSNNKPIAFGKGLRTRLLGLESNTEYQLYVRCCLYANNTNAYDSNSKKYEQYLKKKKSIIL